MKDTIDVEHARALAAAARAGLAETSAAIAELSAALHRDGAFADVSVAGADGTITICGLAATQLDVERALAIATPIAAGIVVENRLRVGDIELVAARHLFEKWIPEVRNDEVQVAAAARRPGVMMMVAVSSIDDVDAVGACVEGAALLERELGPEQLVICEYHTDPVELVLNAMGHFDFEDVRVNDEQRCIALLVSEEELDDAAGEDGVNLALAAKLVRATGWTVTLTTQPPGVEPLGLTM